MATLAAIQAALIAAWSLLQTVVVGLWKHRSTIIALIVFAEKRRKEGDTEIGTDLERGFHVLTEARSPTALFNAVASRCGDDGCLLPPPDDGGTDP